MTNAEKYQEVFGLPVDTSLCPTKECKFCPCSTENSEGTVFCRDGCPYEFWNKEYKGNGTVKVEIIEHHTFAKPDDVEDIKFGD